MKIIFSGKKTIFLEVLQKLMHVSPILVKKKILQYFISILWDMQMISHVRLQFTKTFLRKLPLWWIERTFKIFLPPNWKILWILHGKVASKNCLENNITHSYLMDSARRDVVHSRMECNLTWKFINRSFKRYFHSFRCKKNYYISVKEILTLV